jgi:hypothetical protein
LRFTPAIRPTISATLRSRTSCANAAGVFKRLRFAGVTLVTLSEGEISELHVGLKGTMNALLLKDLGLKTHTWRTRPLQPEIWRQRRQVRGPCVAPSG